jgi:hypothetical protein
MPEDLNANEHLEPTIGSLVEELGFRETADMSTMRELATEAMASGDERAKGLSIAYLQAGERLVDEQQPQDINRARVGLNIARAFMYRDSGRTDDYAACIEDILDDLYNLVAAGHEDFRGIIERLEADIELR